MRPVLIFLAPWVPLFVLWAVIVRIQGAPTLWVAAGWALEAVGAAAFLSIPARWLCERLPWRARLGVDFVVLHMLAACAFGFSWALVPYAFDATVSGQGILALIAESHVFGWQFLMGLLLYGIVAGIAYTMSFRRKAEEHLRQTVEAQAQAAAARLEAIQARLHPHFLFNALHSLGVLIRSDAGAAETAVESLGQLLRRALSRDGRSLIPMDEEWSFSRKYLEFERIRYGDRLGIDTSVDDEALECLVPPYAIQVLVENAVRHAVDAAEGGRIDIRARVVGERLLIEVGDQGAPADGGARRDSQQFGLAALRERLANLYDRTAQIETQNLRAGGFRVQVSLPAVRLDAENGMGG